MTDPIPHRTHHNNRAAEDTALLRKEAKGQGHGGVLRRAGTHIAAVAPDRFLRRAVRHHGAVWRLLRHHRRLCEECTRRRAVYRGRDRSARDGWQEKRGAASLSSPGRRGVRFYVNWNLYKKGYDLVRTFGVNGRSNF